MLEERDTRAARRDATTQRILKAAWRLAHRDGLQGFSLRDLAKGVGMRAPSLYSYFDSKMAIYDAMFAHGARQHLDVMSSDDFPDDFVEAFKEGNRRFFRFCVSDPARHQLLFQRTIPGFEPSPESYAIAVEALERFRAFLRTGGIDDQRAVDWWTAISGGLINQQIANDPGGDRWERLLDEAVDMYLKQVGYKKKGGRR